MARRTVLTSRQRSALFALPEREADLLRHYTLSDEDLQNIEARRRPRNKLGFALQLCVLRHPGRLLAPGEFVSPAVVNFIGRQLDLDGDDLADYAVRSETRHEHLAELRRLYGFRSFSGGAARELADRLREEAEQAQSNEDLVRRFVEACRPTRTILPATTTIERLCADALVDAERRIEARIAERVPPGLRRDLEHLLEETADAGVTRFVWLRQFEPGSNSADANRLLDRLEHLRRLDVPEGLFHEIPPHRITRLRRQGERYFADGLRELPDNRRLAILAVCAVEWEMFLVDAVVETHDRVVGRTYREGARVLDSKSQFMYSVPGLSRSGSFERAACTAMCRLTWAGVPAASTRRTRSMLSGTPLPWPKTAMRHRRSSDAPPGSSWATSRRTRAQDRRAKSGSIRATETIAAPVIRRSILRAPDRARGRGGRPPARRSPVWARRIEGVLQRGARAGDHDAGREPRPPVLPELHLVGQGEGVRVRGLVPTEHEGRVVRRERDVGRRTGRRGLRDGNRPGGHPRGGHHQPTVARPSTALLVPPCIGFSRRCASPAAL